MWMRKFVWKITRVTIKTSQICQYRVCPPVASMQATQRRRILLMSLAICSWGILVHSCCKAAPKAWSVLGRGTLCRARWPRMSQRCSVGDKSGDRAGQSRWSTLFCFRTCCTILARWGLALSSCSTTWYHKTSSSIPVMFNNGTVRCEVDSDGLNRHSCSSSWETFAQLFGAYWNKSVCSNRAESTSQRWT